MGKNNRKAKFDKELIYQLYEIDGLSTKQISKKLSCAVSFIYYLLKKYNINIRNKSESTKLWHKNNINPLIGLKKPWLSKAMSGENHFFFGKKRPDMSEKFTGEGNPMFNKPVSEGTRKLLSLAGIGRIVSEETRKVISETHIGKPKSEATKKKLSELAIIRFKNPENHPRWAGGTSEINNLIRTSETYKKWRTSIFTRDNFKCIFCESNEKLCVDHIIPFAVIIVKNNINTMSKAINCKELWAIENGRVLCNKCHLKTDTYGNKTREILKDI